MKPVQLLAYFDRISDAPDAIPRLRRFILDLAVRGKLLEQDSNGEPACELLKRIEAERARLLTAGEVKTFESSDPIRADELPFILPSGWEAARLGQLARKLGAGSTPLGGKSVYQKEGVPFLRSQNVHDNGLRLDDVALISRSIHNRMSGTHVQRHDILLNITGASIGRCALVPTSFLEGNVSQHVAIIRLFLPAIREFIHLALTSPLFQRLIDEVQVGVSREGLSMQRLRRFPMLVPPLAEQHRIVARAAELMAQCDRLGAAQAERESRRDRLVAASLQRLSRPANADGPSFRERVCFHLRHLPRLTLCREHMQQHRQTILDLAIRGQLVAQDGDDEPAIEFDPEREVGVVPFQIPRTWRWARLRSLGQLKGGGTPSKGRHELWNGSIPWVSPKDMKHDYIEKAQLAVTQEAIANSPVTMIDPGAILFVVRGMILAHSFPVAIGRVPLTINQDMKALSLRVPEMAEFLLSALKGLKQHVLAKVQRSSHGTCRIEGTDYSDLLVPIPPPAEQARIVSKVHELLGLCDRLEAQLTTSHTEHHRLLEAVLAKALGPAA